MATALLERVAEVADRLTVKVLKAEAPSIKACQGGFRCGFEMCCPPNRCVRIGLDLFCIRV